MGGGPRNNGDPLATGSRPGSRNAKSTPCNAGATAVGTKDSGKEGGGPAPTGTTTADPSKEVPKDNQPVMDKTQSTTPGSVTFPTKAASAAAAMPTSSSYSPVRSSFDGGGYSTTTQVGNTPVSITGSRSGVSVSYIPAGGRTDTTEGRVYGAQHYYDTQSGKWYTATPPPPPPPRDHYYYRKNEPSPLETALARVKQLEDSRAEYSVQIRKHAKEWVDTKTAGLDEERKLWETRRAALEEENSRLKEECRSLRALVKEEDGVSGAELKQAIIDLRVKINALGNLFLDRWDQKRRRVQNDINRVPKSLMKLLGARFIERMCHQTSPDPTILDYVAQACMVHYITDVIHSFCYGLTDEQNRVFQEVYEEIYQKEPIFVSSQWRTLAHMYGKLTIKDQEKAVAKRMASELLGHLENIDSFIGGQGGRIQSEFGRDVDDIVESTMHLITMLKESVSSVIYEIYSPREGVFEEVQMQDVLGKAQSGEVLCTAEMGLLEFSPKNRDGKFVEDGLVLLKAKVIVEKPGARATNKPAKRQ